MGRYFNTAIHMLIGLIMLLGPGVFFLVTLPFSGRFRHSLRSPYRVFGGFVVFAGSGISYYLAFHAGDQGGIAAYFFQIGVILAYTLLSISLVGLNWILAIKETRKSG